MPHTTLQEIIVALERQLHNPAVRQSLAEAALLIADDFIEFGRSGKVYDKEGILKAMATEVPVTACNLTAYGYNLRILAPNAAQLTYRTCRKQENKPDIDTLRSSIWKLIDGHWQITFHQATPTLASA